jgi:hypothetical protein
VVLTVADLNKIIDETVNEVVEEVVNEVIEELQTTFNEDTLEELVEEGELENVYSTKE